MRTYRKGLIAVVLTGCLTGLAYAQDTVEYRDPRNGQVRTDKGTISEDTVAGIKLRLGAGSQAVPIPADAIINISYADLPRELILEYPAALNAERERDFEKALDLYSDLVEKIPADKNARRHAEFRVAMLKAQMTPDKFTLSDSINTLKSFVSSHANTWQFAIAARTLANLQILDRQFDEALTTLKKLSEAPGLPEDAKKQLQLKTIDTLIAADKPDDAKSLVTSALAGLAASDPQRRRLEVYSILVDPDAQLEGSVKKLEEIIAGTEEPALRALAFNTMGDLYRQKGKDRDAMWSYLWVDVVYSQDPQEHLKAVTRLIDVFGQMGQPEREQEYRQKVKDIR